MKKLVAEKVDILRLSQSLDVNITKALSICGATTDDEVCANLVYLADEAGASGDLEKVSKVYDSALGTAAEGKVLAIYVEVAIPKLKACLDSAIETKNIDEMYEVYRNAPPQSLIKGEALTAYLQTTLDCAMASHCPGMLSSISWDARGDAYGTVIGQKIHSTYIKLRDEEWKKRLAKAEESCDPEEARLVYEEAGETPFEEEAHVVYIKLRDSSSQKHYEELRKHFTEAVVAHNRKKIHSVYIEAIGTPLEQEARMVFIREDLDEAVLSGESKSCMMKAHKIYGMARGTSLEQKALRNLLRFYKK